MKTKFDPGWPLDPSGRFCSNKTSQTIKILGGLKNLIEHNNDTIIGRPSG